MSVSHCALCQTMMPLIIISITMEICIVQYFALTDFVLEELPYLEVVNMEEVSYDAIPVAVDLLSGPAGTRH